MLFAVLLCVFALCFCLLKLRKEQPMSAPLTVHFIRHGEVHNPEQILYGRMPGYILSTRGREQATAAANYISQYLVDTLYISPMERAQETAQIIAAAQTKPPFLITDERLNEVHTPYDGTKLAELEKTLFDLYTGNTEPHEYPRDARRRVLEFLAEKRQQHPNGRIAAVTHGDIVVTTFMYVTGGDPDDLGRLRLEERGLSERYPVTASILTLTYHTDQPNEIPTWSYHRPYDL